MASSFVVSSPGHVLPSATGVTVLLVGTGTTWTTTNPTFAVDQGTITGQTIQSDTTATLLYSAPSSSMLATFSDNVDALTATLQCTTPVLKWFPGLCRAWPR